MQNYKYMRIYKYTIRGIRMYSDLLNRGGYIALISSLIISAVMVLIAVAVGQMSFLGRAAISDVHFKEKSRALAGACANTALLKLAENSSYAGNETIIVASDTCKIFTIVSSSTGRIVDAQGTFRNSYTNFRITVATSAVDVIKWEEVKKF